MEPDAYGTTGEYVVTSLYYGSADLRCYWEKIDGIKFRRKLRIRRYERQAEMRSDEPVFVEIKQRLDKTIQKRRAKLVYPDALGLCAGEEISHDPADSALVGEVRVFVGTFRLEPKSIVSYFRSALVGGSHDPGLRVTFDTDIRYRDGDLALDSKHPGRHMVHPEMCVLEIKANERLPLWVVDLIGHHNIQLIRVSKYCQSIEVSGSVPQSVFHMPDPPTKEDHRD